MAAYDRHGHFDESCREVLSDILGADLNVLRRGAGLEDRTLLLADPYLFQFKPSFMNAAVI
jgi:hypothetical protein